MQNNGKSFHLHNKRQGNRKLGYGQVQDIRTRYANGATQAQLCREYGMSVGQIGRIVRGESWSDAGGAVVTGGGSVPMLTPEQLAESGKRIAALQEEVRSARPDTREPGLDPFAVFEREGGEVDGSGLVKLNQAAKEQGNG